MPRKSQQKGRNINHAVRAATTTGSTPASARSDAMALRDRQGRSHHDDVVLSSHSESIRGGESVGTFVRGLSIIQAHHQSTITTIVIIIGIACHWTLGPMR